MKSTLIFIKIIHSAIWLLFVTIIAFVIYCGITGNIDIYTWIAICLVVFEGVVLLVFKNKCPLTIVARRYSNSKQDNFDIFLPNWLAKYNKRIFTTIFIGGLIVVLLRYMF
jgi:hypothetical protein